MEAVLHKTPADMAEYLAGYITDPSKIVTHTANEFGKQRAVPLKLAKGLVAKQRRGVERFRELSNHKSKDSEKFDHLDFDPRIKVRPKRVAKWVAPEPTNTPWPKWYRPDRARLRIDELHNFVAAYFQMPIETMLGQSRSMDTVSARAVIIKILHGRGHSYPTIAKLVNRTCHSTTINSVRNFDYYCRRDPRVLIAYQQFGDGV